MQDQGFPNGANDAQRGIDFIGVCCGFVCHDGNQKFVLSKRSMNCRDEQGCWEHGGGAHEFGQQIEETVRREIKEEYGADARNLRFLGTFELLRTLDDGTPTHWLQVLYGAEVDPSQVRNNEPYKIEQVDWFTLDTLPSAIRPHVKRSLDTAHATGII
jgi:8-oxo-dGTP pyrophosphatase MutT (NUDIX family)